MANGNNLLYLLKDPTFNFLKEIFEFLCDFFLLTKAVSWFSLRNSGVAK